MRIALDAMGGDNAPTEIVKGAVAAVQEEPTLEVILVGDQERIRQALGSCNGSMDRIHV
ncbi:MAG: phosphate acyltransferase PlsX, partial [Planctomycetota bacterium]